KLEITAAPIFKSRRRSKKSALLSNDSKVAQLSAMVNVNTKLKTDPFLKDSGWTLGIDGYVKETETKSELVLIKKKDPAVKESNVLQTDSNNADSKQIDAKGNDSTEGISN